MSFVDPGEPTLGLATFFHINKLRGELAGRPVRVSVQAAEDVGLGQVAAVTSSGVVPASRLNLSHAGKVLGVVTQGAMSGEEADVQLAGALADVLSAAPGCQLWLDVDGAVRDTPPQSGFQQEVALAITTDLAIVELGVPIILA